MKPEKWLGQDDSELVSLDDKHKLHPSVLEAFSAMQHAAICDGIDLQLVSSYRTFDRQCAIWNSKWLGKTELRDANSAVIDTSIISDIDKLHAILTWSALPGGSRHHWGTDIDVYDRNAVKRWSGTFSLIEEEYESQGPCHELALWLQSHMQRFGFFMPFEKHNGGVAREPWHLSHRATSQAFEHDRNLTHLTNAIRTANIEGKAVIIDNIEMIYHRYVLNNGET
ncbi:M15 family metallopeptidase [Alteromonas sp. A079]|uniref:M15 family metallopeptidase n=1 Tax=Alteromonas sp. A079 TaxID=3410268 RepID=UPI003BA24770